MATQFSAADFGTPGKAAPAAQSGWSAADFAPRPAPMEGPAQDTLWSSVKTAGARVLNSVGYGAKQAWGSEPLGIGADTQKFLQNAGIFNDYQDGHSSLIKAANEAILRPAAAVADALGRTLAVPFGAVAGAGTQIAKEVEGDHPTDLRTAIASPFGATGSAAGMATEGLLLPEIGFMHWLHPAAEGAADLPRQAAAARSVGAVGEGETGFYDAAPVTPENVQARAAAAQEAGIAPVTDTPQPIVEAPQPAPTQAEVARRIDPETFGQYDALTAQRETYRSELERLQDERLKTPEFTAAKDDVANLLGVEDEEPIEATIARENAFRASASPDQIARLDDAMDRLEHAYSSDTPEQAALRDKLTQANLALRDLAPQMSEAMRNAADIMPEQAERPVIEPKSEAGETKETESAAEKPRATAAAAGEGTSEGANVLGNDTLGGGASQEGGPANVVGDQTLGTTPRAQETVEPATETASAEGGSAPGGEATKPRYTNALRPTEGTGDLATRSLGASVEARAIEEGLASNFGDLPEYHRLSMADQADKALKLIDKDYETAKAIALGDKQPPKGLLPESMYVAVEKHALAIGDVDTLRQLAIRSRLNTAATTMGQRIRALGERDQASPIGAIQEVQAARAADIAKRMDVAKETRAAMDDARAEMRKAASVDKWSDFLQSIVCSGE